MLLFFPSLTPSFLLISLSSAILPSRNDFPEKKMDQRGVIVLKQFSRVPRLKMSGHKSLANCNYFSLHKKKAQNWRDYKQWLAACCCCDFAL